MAIAQGAAGAETPDTEPVIVPTSIYAPGTLKDIPDADGPPPAGHTTGPGAGPAAGYPPTSAPGGMPGPGPRATAFPQEQQAAPGPGADSGPAQNAGYGDPGYGGHPYGDYAYVLQEEVPPAPRQPRPRATGPAASSPGNQPPPQEPPRSEPPAFIYRDPSSPALDDPAAEPATAYGPDDPAYGPPRPGWDTEDQAEQRAAEALQSLRGAFEPPVNQGESAPNADEGDPATSTTALDQIRDFYLTAEAIDPENLDRHFDELLERQRQLISDYFSEAALQESTR